MMVTLEEEFAAYGGGNEYRWIGPPGCGKTHKAAHLAAWAARKYGPEKVMLTSFSKAAAAILRGRTDIPKENVGTLHSLALRAIGGLGSRRNVVSSRKGHLKLFSEKYPRYAIQAVRTVDNDGSYSTAKSDFPGEALLNERDRLAELLRDQEAWKPEIRYFHDAWERFKQEEGLIDFHDMIRIAYEDTDCAPGDPDVMVCDEAQDFSLLQTRLIRKWGLRTQFFILIGDDDQCQPPDTLVHTPGGIKSISELNPDSDSLLSWDPKTYGILGNGKPIRFQRQDSYADGLLKVKAGERESRCTKNHLWTTRWNYPVADRLYAVYLMHLEGKWRVGWTKLIRSDHTLHLGVRARLERADAAWILRVTDSKAEASILESFIATQYGLPLMMFQTHTTRLLYTQPVLDSFFQLLNSNEQMERAKRCLEDHGRLLELPFWTRERAAKNKYGTVIQVTAASNLIPGAMQIARVDGSGRDQFSWHAIQAVTPVAYRGNVTGLQVDRYHTYIADGLVTHNCVYQFRGASPDSLIDPPIKSDHYGILDQSYRVPRQVHAYATKWIERVDPDHRLAKEYKPRDADGVVSSIDATYREPFNVINDAAGQLKNGRSVMFIATCNYMLHEMIRIMRQNGVPYSNKYSPGNNYWNPLKRHKFMHGLLSFLPAVTGEQRAWTVEELCSWADCLKGMARKWRDKISDVPLQVAADEKILDMVLGDKYDALFDAMDKGEGLQFFLGNTLAEYRDDLHRDDKYPGTMQYVENVIASGGVETLYNQELINRVTIGTIHSVKGGEADVVYLFPDIPEAMKLSWNYNTGGSRDDIYRLFYVGMTRAREELVLAAPAAQTLAVRFA